MGTTTGLVTVADLDKLPKLDEGRWYELHHGEVVIMTRPVMKHYRIQRRLARLHESASGDMIVGTELAFRAEPEHEFRIAGVAAVHKQRWDAVDPNGYLTGAPDIVIEVLSPSNTASEMLDKRELCLKNGCREFWIVNPDRRTVEVATSEGQFRIYSNDAEIRIQSFGGTAIKVSDIFEE
jgi:Uma2 family endonuclease